MMFNITAYLSFFLFCLQMATAYAADASKPVAPPPPPPAKTETKAGVPASVKLPGMIINVQYRYIDVDAEVVLENGALEIIACTKDTKEHESIVVLDAKAMHIHAALLLLGAKPGNPAMNRSIDAVKAALLNSKSQGTNVDVSIVVLTENGKAIEHPITKFIKRWEESYQNESDSNSHANEKFPTHTFVFAGSHLVPQKVGNHKYLADDSGNVISISTFGDEMLRLPMDYSYDNGSLIWAVDDTDLPPVGTKVKIRLRPWSDGKSPIIKND